MTFRRNLCLSLYRRLANAFPWEFRMIHGEDLDRLGEDAVPEAWRRYGALGLVRLLADIALRLPAEYLSEFRQDLVYAARVLAKAPGFTAVAVISLAVGIGMCCTVYSEQQSLAGPAPGLRDPATLVTLRNLPSYPYFERYREQRRAVVSAAAFLNSVPFAVAYTADKRARAERFYGHLVSPEYFTTLGVTPAAGRFFSPETERPGMDPVVVVSYRFWRAHLGGDPAAVGRKLRLNGTIATIVGIGPKDFLGMWPINPGDLFVPLTAGAALAPELAGDALHRPDREMFHLVARLPRGVTIQMAEAAFDAVTRNFDRERGVQRERDRKGRSIRLMPAGTVMRVTPEQTTFFNVFGIVLWGLVLTLTCTNLANLQLAKASQRRPEIAVRLSIGASRGRLVRQLLTESVLLSFVGGLAGIVVALGMTHAISSMPLPSPNAFEFSFRPDFHVLANTLWIALGTGIGFGLVPALASARTDIGITLKEGAQAPLRGYRRLGLRNFFVVGQMAVSLMLVLVTWYIAIGFLHTARLDPGFQIANLDMISIDPVRDGFSSEQVASLAGGLTGEIARIDGVRGVALAGTVPFASLNADQANTRVSAPVEGQKAQVLYSVFRDRIGAGYFAALGVPLVGGREFDRRDQDAGAGTATTIPAIVNQTAARELFAGESPIGRQIHEGNVTYTVVGVTRDAHSGFLSPTPVATVFLPLTVAWFRDHPSQRATVLLRGTAGRDTLAAVRNQLATQHPGLTVFNAHSMQEDLDRMNSFVEWDSAIYIILGLFALLLACVGLGGVTAHAVARRRKEIGIRMALGARGGQVQGLVLREGLALVVVGSLLGFAGTYALTRAFSAYSDVLASVFGKRVDDPLLVVGAPLLLASLAMLACYLPARRATRIDPVSALRDE